MSTKTTLNFNQMLKKYLPYNLLAEEFIKRNYFMQKVNIKDGWKGGQMDIPFKAAKATDYRFGGLVSKSKLGKARYGIGSVNEYKELWGAMVFDDHDLMRHGDMEQSFINILPDQINDFVFGMKEVVARSLLNGGHICKVNDVTNAATGVVGVPRPEFFDLDQFIEFRDAAGVLLASGFVNEIHMADMAIVVKDARIDAGGAVVDLAAAGVVIGSKVTIQGDSTTAAFTSLDSQLLPASAGGSANIFGVNKLSTPYTQSYAVDGSGLASDAQGLLHKIFQTQNRVRAIANGSNPSEAVMGYGLLATIMEALETGGAAAGSVTNRQYYAKDMKTSLYGWTEIEVVGIGGTLKLVGVNEMADDSIKILDWRGIDMHTNGLFERHKDINGNEFTVVRNDEDTVAAGSTGFQYITDIRMFGELVVSKPSYQATIHSID